MKKNREIENSNKDFHIRVLKNERLIDTIQGLDADFETDMLDVGNLDNLPNSDKIMICQQKGIKEKKCNYLEN